MTSSYPGMENHKVHPKGANIHKELKNKDYRIESLKYLNEVTLNFIDTCSKKFTKVKFSLILTKGEFAIGAYRNEGSKAFFGKLLFEPNQKRDEEWVSTNYSINRYENNVKLKSRLSFEDIIITLFSLIGDQVPFKLT